MVDVYGSIRSIFCAGQDNAASERMKCLGIHGSDVRDDLRFPGKTTLAFKNAGTDRFLQPLSSRPATR